LILKIYGAILGNMKLFEFITNIFKVQEEVKELNNESIIDYTREFISENTYRFNSECSDSLNLFKKKINELKDNISLLENAEIPKANKPKATTAIIEYAVLFESFIFTIFF